MELTYPSQRPQSPSLSPYFLLKTGMRAVSKEVVAQTVTKAGQEMMKTGMQAVAKEVVTQSATKTGQVARFKKLNGSLACKSIWKHRMLSNYKAC